MNKERKEIAEPSRFKDDCMKKENLQEIVLEALQKFDVQLTDRKNELTFLNFDISRYQQSHSQSVFGEKQSLSYMFHFITYNVKYTVKLLVFQYDDKMEVLKLDIEPQNWTSKKELEYCCNYLKRRRNLKLMFEVLIQFSRNIEARRLICDIILKKNNFVTIQQNKDGGIIIVYCDITTQIKFGIFWSIVCTPKLGVTDMIEVYYKSAECLNHSSVKQKLIRLTQTNLNFTTKYHLLRDLFQELSFYNSHNSEKMTLQNSISDTMTFEIMDASEAEGVVILSDSEDNSLSSSKSVNSVPSTSSRSATEHLNHNVSLPQNTVCQSNRFPVVPVSTAFLETLNQSNYAPKHSNNTECGATPAKKYRRNTTNEDIEITSITYVVPD
ncbi:uncharacterized protein LOC115884938 [Sitophilus oryzae]|uniref:Uncharacterized protein LOC115884938 n=1 Tax=Sitophilus oryzae TaxID=7048 RepID=A0A6J2Y8N6_SITOR|nr:uncharacterized protein LOC115884938 [Sitophilus oryzae]